jgi:hypothetical protein
MFGVHELRERNTRSADGFGGEFAHEFMARHEFTIGGCLVEFANHC